MATPTNPYVRGDFDGPTFNKRPVVPRDSDLTVRCRRDRMRGDPADCEWEGTVAELDRGRSKMGSQPIEKVCPECGMSLAAIKGTTSAGYWNGKFD